MRRTVAVERTRAAIEAAALELFEKDGYEATHVTHVAEVAGVSRRTVFRHFPRKEELVFSDADDDTAAVVEALRARPADERPFEALWAAVREGSAEFDHELTALRLRVISGNALLTGRAAMLRHQWVEAVAGALRTRGVADDDARALAEVGAAVMREAMRRWAEDDHRSLADHIDDVVAAVLRAVR